MLAPELEEVQTLDCQQNRDVQPVGNLEDNQPEEIVYKWHIPQDDKNDHHDDIAVLVDIETQLPVEVRRQGAVPIKGRHGYQIEHQR